MTNAFPRAAVGLGLAAFVGQPLTTTPGRAADPEVSKEIIAVQIRKQGFPCKNPVSATRDKQDSEVDQAAWILVCDGATYKVQLIPKMAAKVERLDDEEEQAAPQDPAAPQP